MLNDYLTITNFNIEKIQYQPAEQYFQQFADFYGSVLLTGKGEAGNAQYSFIGKAPIFEIKFQNGEILLNGAPTENSDPWQTLTHLLENSQFHHLDYPANICGFIGYLSYEMAHSIESFSVTTQKNYKVPDFLFLAYRTYYVFDNSSLSLWRVDIDYELEKENNRNIRADDGFSVTNLKPDFTKSEYLQRVRSIQEYIRSGDVYEVNFTQQLRGDFSGNSYELFKQLYQVNPAPYSCYFNLDDLIILSNSPELFLRAKNENLETRPIKGTIKRGISVAENAKKKQQLLHSAKDQAELYMIIDLLRNDLGKISEIGSVYVENSKKFETYENVYHLVGVIKSRLHKDKNYVDLLKAAFPGGSITGCPKLRAMEIIDELEISHRNIYTGSILLMNQGYLNASIVIRTVVIKDSQLFVNSGGAITIDSSPEDEYAEMKTKINNIIRTFEG